MSPEQKTIEYMKGFEDGRKSESGQIASLNDRIERLVACLGETQKWVYAAQQAMKQAEVAVGGVNV